MRRKIIFALVVALLVAVAGCASTAPQGASPDDAKGTDTEATTATGDSETNNAVVNFYISDEENAIGDFRRVNVTVTKVGFERAEGGWKEYSIDNKTVDLTELQGKNATLVESYEVPEGAYTKVFLYVSAVNATLENGEEVRVKLPSERLHINKEFTVENGSQVDFVFDITVHKAGKSGKYILKPVVSESGTDVDIEERGEETDDDERVERGDGSGEGNDESAALNTTFVGNVTPGGNATVAVMYNGSAVGNATVIVNDREVGTTGADGQLTFAVPDDAEELDVEVRDGDLEAQLEIEFDDDRGDRTESGSETEGGNQTATRNDS